MDTTITKTSHLLSLMRILDRILNTFPWIQGYAYIYKSKHYRKLMLYGYYGYVSINVNKDTMDTVTSTVRIR